MRGNPIKKKFENTFSKFDHVENNIDIYIIKKSFNITILLLVFLEAFSRFFLNKMSLLIIFYHLNFLKICISTYQKNIKKNYYSKSIFSVCVKV